MVYIPQDSAKALRRRNFGCGAVTAVGSERSKSVMHVTPQCVGDAQEGASPHTLSLFWRLPKHDFPASASHLNFPPFLFFNSDRSSPLHNSTFPKFIIASELRSRYP